MVAKEYYNGNAVVSLPEFGSVTIPIGEFIQVIFVGVSNVITPFIGQHVWIVVRRNAGQCVVCVVFIDDQAVIVEQFQECRFGERLDKPLADDRC